MPFGYRISSAVELAARSEESIGATSALSLIVGFGLVVGCVVAGVSEGPGAASMDIV
jgi:hypothetical protein